MMVRKRAKRRLYCPHDWRWVVLVFAAGGLAIGCSRKAAPQPLPELTINGQVFRVELAISDAKRQRGLMHRTALPADRGMLFAFDVVAEQRFWMRDTPLALDIAFINAERVIVNIATMEPYDDQTRHRSKGPVKYALEVRAGSFRTYGIGAGDVVEFSAELLKRLALSDD